MAVRRVSLLLLFALTQLRFLLVLTATVEDIRLIGDSDSFINVKSTREHMLRCSFRAGYDDQVSSVRWLKDDKVVYSWHEGSSEAYAFLPLLGYVKTSEKPQLQNLYFRRYSLKLSGNYTCEVNSALGTTRSKPFRLIILDLPNEDFTTNVTLLQSTSSSSESPNCTLLWDFKTPAIFPKPNVTCGYYSYLHDDVVDGLPSGLNMKLLTNGSWEAGFYHTQVQVADIPRKERLGCTVTVPDTSYKKVVKFEDSYVIDHLIDSEGCPTLSLNSMHNLLVSSEGGEMNCRGDMIATSNDIPSKVNFRCFHNYVALFSNGTAVHNWSSELICDSQLKVWQKIDNGIRRPVNNITEFLPVCVGRMDNGGIALASGLKLTLLLNFALLYIYIIV